MYIYIYKYVCIYIYTYLYIYIFICVYIYIWCQSQGHKHWNEYTVHPNKSLLDSISGYDGHHGWGSTIKRKIIVSERDGIPKVSRQKKKNNYSSNATWWTLNRLWNWNMVLTLLPRDNIWLYKKKKKHSLHVIEMFDTRRPLSSPMGTFQAYFS